MVVGVKGALGIRRAILSNSSLSRILPNRWEQSARAPCGHRSDTSCMRMRTTNLARRTGRKETRLCFAFNGFLASELEAQKPRNRGESYE